MKKYIMFLLLCVAFTGCEDDGFSNNNPYLPNYNFSVPINLDLPLYSRLNFPGNAVLVTESSAGINGVIVFNSGSGFYAWEASCPNQELDTCSQLEIDGIEAVCPCDNAVYSLYNGQSEGLKYTLKPYRIEIIGNMLTIYN